MKHPFAFLLSSSLFLPLWGAHGNSVSVEAVISERGQNAMDASAATTAQQPLNNQTAGSRDSVPCGMWLAPSTIPGAGLGMYAGRDYAPEEDLQTVGDLVIPIVDIEEHAKRYSSADWTCLWDEYTWDSESLRMDNEGQFEVNAASPGFGAAANSFLGIFNVEEWTPRYDMANLHRSQDPGAGAFTPYYNRRSTAKHVIRAGEEFFVSYGENWFQTRSHFGPVPLFKDLNRATKLAKTFHKVKARVPDHVMEDLWDTFIRNTSFKDSRVIGSFHHDSEDEMQQLERKSLKQIRREQSTRSLEWLENHGTCGDHIIAGDSKIPQAGRGAFANRALPAGTTLAQLPLIHIPDRNRLNMYDLDKDAEETDPSDTVGQQLLLNYCFGHGESTLLLCPYGPMVNYVNHHSSKANVQLRWSEPSRGNHMPDLLNKSIDALEADATAKLAFEFVATRDIQPGEEIYLDYGQEFEQAWQDHVANWKPANGADTYIPAWKMDQDAPTPLRTVFEELEQPTYPKNVQLRCDKAFLDDDKEWVAFAKNGTISSFLDRESEPLLVCEVMRYSVKDGEFRYTVILVEDDPEDNNKVVNHLIEDIPRAGITFVDRPYTSDLFLPNAFRHDIRIPDSIFPNAWRNKLSSTPN